MKVLLIILAVTAVVGFTLKLRNAPTNTSSTGGFGGGSGTDDTTSKPES